MPGSFDDALSAVQQRIVEGSSLTDAVGVIHRDLVMSLRQYGAAFAAQAEKKWGPGAPVGYLDDGKSRFLSQTSVHQYHPLSTSGWESGISNVVVTTDGRIVRAKWHKPVSYSSRKYVGFPPDGFFDVDAYSAEGGTFEVSTLDIAPHKLVETCFLWRQEGSAEADVDWARRGSEAVREWVMDVLASRLLGVRPDPSKSASGFAQVEPAPFCPWA